jgi:hypothetical protein
MATDVTPFLNVADFSGMFPRQPMSDQETNLAGLLLQAAARWIRDAIAAAGRTPLDPADPMARLVSYEVVRDALAVPGDLAGHLSYQRMTDNRSEGGTLVAAGNLLEFTPNHRKMLGLTASALPQGSFDGYPDPIPAWHYQNTPAGPVTVGTVVIGEAWP